MDDCVFCRIVAGDLPAAKFYEDDNVLGFVTIESINKGHCLVIPKQHIDKIYDLGKELYTEVMEVGRRASIAVQKAFDPARVGLAVSGWEVPHAHLHIVPMDEATDVGSKKLWEGRGINFSPDERNEQALVIKGLM